MASASVKDTRLRLEIKLERSYLAPGDQVKGQLVIQWTGEDEILCDGVSVKFTGEARTCFFGGRSNKVKYSGRRLYFDHEEFVLGSDFEVGDRKSEIYTGINEYDFNYKLPTQLPGSFMGTHGFVKYRVYAELKGATHPPHLPAVFQEVIITVIPSLDPALMPSKELPGHVSSKEKQHCMGFIPNGFLTFSTSTPKVSYGEAQIIPVSIELDGSKCRIKVVKIHCWLCLRAVYTGENHLSRHKEVRKEQSTSLHPLCLASNPGIESGGKITWKCQLEVPLGTPPTDLGGYCDLIDVTYTIRTELELTSGSRYVQELPILIGTVEDSSEEEEEEEEDIEEKSKDDVNEAKTEEVAPKE